MNSQIDGLECNVSRRGFLGIAVAGVALPWSSIAEAAASENKRGGPTEVCIFSKHLQWLDYAGMARTAREIGFDGIDLTVRPGGHVLPERVREDLPRAIAAAKIEALDVPMMTTAITDPSDPLTESILATASQAGIRYYRMGYYQYDDAKPVHQTLNEAKAKIRDLVEMNKHYNIVGAYQNHAGAKYVGAPIWDLDILFGDLDTRWIGSQFDIRHATVEGGLAWPTDFRLVSRYINTIVAKDFKWTQKAGSWQAENCPLGEGMVDFPRYFKMLRRAEIVVPMSLHFEYPIGGAEHGARRLTVDKRQVIEAMKRDLRFVRNLAKSKA
ncbi:MAG: TIM barrel protein [Sedimentisphaerales bacterium]|jgi:sugar phosphate isomerase/epimerase